MSRFFTRDCFFHGAKRGAFTTMVLAAVVGCLIPTYAEARPDTRSMSCEQTRDFVKKKGSAVMNTGPNTYDRFVASRQFCVSQKQFLIRAFVPTKDNKSCHIGYTCQEERPIFGGGF